MKKVICIIDDDPIYQFLIKKVIAISKIGYDSLCFTNGKEALDYFNSETNKKLPEIILLDIEMPIMDGWDFLKEAKKLPLEQTAIYVVSSSISHEDKEKIKSFTKVSGHFSKPFDVNKMLQITTKEED